MDASPLSRQTVKARQARKNVEVWVRGVCFFFPSNSFTISSSFCGLLLFNLSQEIQGATFPAKKLCPDKMWQALRWLGRVPEFEASKFSRNGGHLWAGRERLVAINFLPIKYGRQWRWVGFPSFNDCAFADRCHF